MKVGTPDPSEPEMDGLVAVTIRIPASEARDLELVIKLWNALAPPKGSRGRKKTWKAASVVRRWMRIGFDGVRELYGQWPVTPKEQDEWVKQVAAKVRKDFPKEK